MPWNEVMGKYKRGELKSGSDKGPPVKNRKQAIAIMMSEKREAAKGNKEYQAHAKGGMVKYAAGGATESDADLRNREWRASHNRVSPEAQAIGTKEMNRMVQPQGGSWNPGNPTAPHVMSPQPPSGYDDGGSVNKNSPAALPPPPPRPKPANPPPVNVLPGAEATKVDIPQMVSAKKGGKMGFYNKGGAVCASNKKQMKQNLIETVANPTGKMELEKGGYVKPSWRRW